MRRLDGHRAADAELGWAHLPQPRRPVVPAPRPGVAEPELRHEVERGGVRAVVDGGDADADVVGGALRVGRDDVEEAAALEHAGVGELQLGVLEAAGGVALHQRCVRVGSLRVAVELLGVGVGGGGVEVPPELLHVFSVVALRVRDAEPALLEAVVLAVPERDSEVEAAVAVAQAADAVLAPAVGAGVRLVEREGRPRVAVGGVVLADRAPLAARDIGPPEAPRVVVGG